MYINNRWYTETEVKAYVDKLIEENEKMKTLLKSAIKILDIYGGCIETACSECTSSFDKCDYDDYFRWKHMDEALKLIGEDGERND